MSIMFRIPGPLLPYTGGRTLVQADAAAGTVEEALAQLWRLYPGLRERVLTDTGEVRPHVNVLVGTESIRDTGGLATPLAGPAEIAIVPAVSAEAEAGG